MPGHEKHSVVFPCGEDTYDLLKDSPLPLNFSPDEEKLGQEVLKNFGIQTPVRLLRSNWTPPVCAWVNPKNF